MPPTLRVCSAPGCPTLVEAGRCAAHAPAASSSRNHFGVSPSRRGHGRAYQGVRRQLVGQPCHWCGRTADTADYSVPWSKGGRLSDLVPACRTCNASRGAALTNGTGGTS